MSNYTAPVRDIRFTLDHIAGFPSVTALEPFSEVTPDLVEAILNEAGRFASEVMAPSNSVGDKQGCTFENGVVRTPDGFPAIYRQYVESGWNSLPFSTEIGGQGLPIALTIATNEMWAASNMAFSLAATLNHGAVEVLEAYGTEEQKKTYLEKDGVGRVGLHHEPDGAASRQRRRRAPHQGRTEGQRRLSHLGPENLHHLWRARSDREYRSSRSCPHAWFAARHQGHFAVYRTEIPDRPGWIARREERPAVCFDRAQDGHPCQPDLCDVLWRRRQLHRLSAGRGTCRHACHVSDDE